MLILVSPGSILRQSAHLGYITSVSIPLPSVYGGEQGGSCLLYLGNKPLVGTVASHLGLSAGSQGDRCYILLRRDAGKRSSSCS